MERGFSRLSVASLPPWLWFWLLIYAVSLPDAVYGIRQQHLSVFRSLDTLPTGVVTGLHVYFLSALPQLLSTLALALGIFTVVVPWLRAAYLERRFRLSETYPTVPALEEIRTFLHAYAPGVEVRVNLLRTDQLAFIYPLGYRRTAIAVFGGMLKLWRSDRRLAEAVLLHEVGHYRQGDTLIVGAGSFFETMARYWLVVCSLSVVAALIDGAIIFSMVADRLGSDLLTTLLGFVLWVVPAAFLEFTGVLFWLVSALIIPLIGGIWCAELNADRFAVGAQGSSKHLTGALGRLAPYKSLWRWFLFRMYHPPQILRRWAANQSGRTGVLIVLLLIFPLTYVAKLIAMSGWALALYLSQCIGGCGDMNVWQELGTNLGYLQDRYFRIWLAMAGLLVLWPIASNYWQWVFSGKSSPHVSSRPLNYRTYAVSAVLVCALAVTFYLAPLSG